MENKNLIIFGLLAVSGISFYLYKKEADKVAVPKSSSNKKAVLENKVLTQKVNYVSNTDSAPLNAEAALSVDGLQRVPNPSKYIFLKDVSVEGQYCDFKIDEITREGASVCTKGIKSYKKGDSILGHFSESTTGALMPPTISWIEDDRRAYAIVGDDAKAMADAAGSTSFSGNEQYWQAFR